MTGTLTELESCTLSVIRRSQPCSTYEVRQVFACSTTPEWSGSTGSVYPVIRRLLKLNLIRAKSAAGNRRGRSNLTVTREGERAINRWIASLEPWAAEATPDPIRTRIGFLGHLPSNAARATFVSRAEKLTQEAIQRLRVLAKADLEADRAEYVVTLGALYQLEARLKWLKRARKVLGTTAKPLAGKSKTPTPKQRTARSGHAEGT